MSAAAVELRVGAARLGGRACDVVGVVVVVVVVGTVGGVDSELGCVVLDEAAGCGRLCLVTNSGAGSTRAEKTQ